LRLRASARLAGAAAGHAENVRADLSDAGDFARNHILQAGENFGGVGWDGHDRGRVKV
jgi:hypothetical protein